MSHTPGPWRLDKWNGYLLSSENISIVKFDVSRTRLQDAQLIAAAPDLLKALDAIINDDAEYPQIDSKLVDKARAAIKKARGEQ